MKPLVVVCHQIGEHQLLPAIDLGLVAVIDRDGATLNRIAEVIVNADAGRAHMSPKVLTAVLRTSRTARAAASVQPLVSARERDVVRLLSEGLATKEVAEGLGCSKRTIENIIMSLNARLRVRNPARLVAFGFHHGLL